MNQINNSFNTIPSIVKIWCFLHVKDNLRKLLLTNSLLSVLVDSPMQG